MVDVREPSEFVTGHVPGAASIPMGQLVDRLGEIDQSRPVFVICQSGGRSSAMTDVLRHHGFDARSVDGGTAAWISRRAPRHHQRPGREVNAMTQTTTHTATAVTPVAPTIIPIETPTLGDRSYLAHDGQVALVVDPQRDIDRVLDLAAAEGVRITHVFETHIHNDYVTGGLALARRTGAAYYVNGADEVAYDRTPIADGDEIAGRARRCASGRSPPRVTPSRTSPTR